MTAPSSAAERDIVQKLARGSLLSRLKGSRQPLKLAAVPRDHVPGDRPRGEALVKEFIPYLESQFHLIAKPEARIVTGHSSGGWSSLWL